MPEAFSEWSGQSDPADKSASQEQPRLIALSCPTRSRLKGGKGNYSACKIRQGIGNTSGDVPRGVGWFVAISIPGQWKVAELANGVIKGTSRGSGMISCLAPGMQGLGYTSRDSMAALTALRITSNRNRVFYRLNAGVLGRHLDISSK